MNQRRPRLGDILDDYCPRERRLTNHAIVAMVEDEVKLTRCTTCDTEHDFKHGKMPTLRRKKDAVSAAYKEVLAAVTGETATPTIAAPAALRDEAADAASAVGPPPEPAVEGAALPAAAVMRADEPRTAAGDRKTEDAVESEVRVAGKAEDGRVHRRLIRATLPRPENHVPDRPVPEFTMRQPTDRGGKFRGGAGRGMGGRHAGGRGGGQHGGQSRGPVFGRPPGHGGGQPGNRVSGRGDGQRPHRGGQPGRPGKKPSK
jgi:hypothetical protein